MWRHIAGLNPDDSQPGWKHFTVAPKPGGGVTWAKSEYASIRGRIACSWKIEGDTFRLDAVIPPNTSATICLPPKYTRSVTENGKPTAQAEGVTQVLTENNAVTISVGGGNYSFAAKFE